MWKVPITILNLHLLKCHRMIHFEVDLEYSRVIKFWVLFNVAAIFFLAVLTPSPLDSSTWGCKFILLLNKWSRRLPEFYYYGKDLIIGIFFNGEISWPVFKVITQSTRYVKRFYFSFIVIVPIDTNIAISIAQVIMASRSLFIQDD